MRLVLALLLAFTSVAVAKPAADDPPPENVRYKRVTDIVIDDVRVGADLKGPIGHFGLEKRQSVFNPLLRLRSDFDREMVDSVHQVR